MEWKSNGDIRWIEFNIFERLPLKHGIFSRQGGVSPSPWQSLNLGGTVGDPKANVVENKRRLLEAIDCDFDSVYDGWQVHSTDYIRVYTPRPADLPHQKADILVTDIPGITLMMRFADCVPIMAYDPVKHVAGIAHAGWKGTTLDVAGHLVKALHKEFGSKSEDLITAIGPSICQKHYQVGEEVIEEVQAILGSDSSSVLAIMDGKVHLDLWKMNEILLERAGVMKIELAKLCTVCHNEDWFSHRDEKGRTGRFGAVIQILQIG
jgi:polyphenol oxidase